LTEAAAKPESGGEGRSLRAYYTLAALLFGLVAGILANRLAQSPRDDVLAAASFV